jgi:hypothetical protein
MPGCELPGFQDKLREFVLPGVADAAVWFQVLDQGQGALVRGKRNRPRARVGIHQQKMDSVGPDIEDA